MRNNSAILVVDDDETNRLMLTYRLELDGLETHTAENGLEALDLLRKEAIDLVLLDILMPEPDGYAVLSKIKADPDLRDIPVVMISAIGDIESVIKCLEIGATDYLPKPLDALLLISRVRNILLSRQLEDVEREYEEQIAQLTEFVIAVSRGEPEPEVVKAIAQRTDGLGKLAQALQTVNFSGQGD